MAIVMGIFQFGSIEVIQGVEMVLDMLLFNHEYNDLFWSMKYLAR